MANETPSSDTTQEEQRFETLLQDPNIVCFVNQAALVTREHFDMANNPVGRFQMMANLKLMEWYGLETTKKMIKSGTWEIPQVMRHSLEEIEGIYEKLPQEQKDKLREMARLSSEVAGADSLIDYAEQNPTIVEPIINGMLDGIEKKKTPDCPNR